METVLVSKFKNRFTEYSNRQFSAYSQNYINTYEGERLVSKLQSL